MKSEVNAFKERLQREPAFPNGSPSRRPIVADELEEVDVEGHRAWLLRAEAAVAFPPVEAVVCLLPTSTVTSSGVIPVITSFRLTGPGGC
jgi:hypothetical protein